METERIALSQRERDRLRVLHEIRRKQITQSEAARRLKISDRHIRRLLVELRKRGDRALLHGLRGRPSNRRLAAGLELKILRRVRQRYLDFGPTLAAEHLAQEGLLVRRWPRDRSWKRGAGAAPFGFKGAAFALLRLSELARQSESIPAHPWHRSSNCSMASLADAVPIFGPRDSGAYSAISLSISSRSTR